MRVPLSLSMVLLVRVLVHCYILSGPQHATKKEKKRTRSCGGLRGRCLPGQDGRGQQHPRRRGRRAKSCCAMRREAPTSWALRASVGLVLVAFVTGDVCGECVRQTSVRPQRKGRHAGALERYSSFGTDVSRAARVQGRGPTTAGRVRARTRSQTARASSSRHPATGTRGK